MEQEKRPIIAKEGYVFIAIFLHLTILSFFLFNQSWTLVFVFFTGFCTYFFRDPHRKIPQEEGLLVSPADGKIIGISKVEEDRFLKKPAIKISIFLDVFNVHINRVPASGKVIEVFYNPGKFFAANLPKASLENEHNAIVLETENGKKIVFIQIAGLVARRIICWAKVGDKLERGERYGLIRFGSRVDLFLPLETELLVTDGDNVKGGESILGILR